MFRGGIQSVDFKIRCNAGDKKKSGVDYEHKYGVPFTSSEGSDWSSFQELFLMSLCSSSNSHLPPML